jgi:hypothetical protein
MSNAISRSLDNVRRSLERHPEEAAHADAGATATVGPGLRVDIPDAAGRTLATDMPAELGGSGSAPTPGTLLRAALASCAATTVAMVAAEQGLELTDVEVTADSRSDHRGMLAITDDGADVVPGPWRSSSVTGSPPPAWTPTDCGRWWRPPRHARR